jgi:hypothetical protein
MASEKKEEDLAIQDINDAFVGKKKKKKEKDKIQQIIPTDQIITVEELNDEDLFDDLKKKKKKKPVEFKPEQEINVEILILIQRLLKNPLKFLQKSMISPL